MNHSKDDPNMTIDLRNNGIVTKMRLSGIYRLVFNRIEVDGIKWKYIDIINNNDYAISKKGEIFSFKNNKYIKPFVKKGYNVVTYFENGVRKQFSLSKALATAFIPNPNNYPIVTHKNHNKIDDRLENLEWTTKSILSIPRYEKEENYDINLFWISKILSNSNSIKTPFNIDEGKCYDEEFCNVIESEFISDVSYD